MIVDARRWLRVLYARLDAKQKYMCARQVLAGDLHRGGSRTVLPVLEAIIGRLTASTVETHVVQWLALLFGLERYPIVHMRNGGWILPYLAQGRRIDVYCLTRYPPRSTEGVAMSKPDSPSHGRPAV